jgi:hypothetical protein
LHILREASIEKAVSIHPNINHIPSDNIAKMNSIGQCEMQKKLDDCSK